MEDLNDLVGNSINIQRTDGRVHSALVASVNCDRRSATVEWFEHGETKGKEVDFDAIISLNPELLPQRTTERIIKEKPVSNADNKLQRESSGSEDETSAARCAKLNESDDEYNSNQISPDTATILNLSKHQIPVNKDKGSLRSLRNQQRKTEQIATTNGQQYIVGEQTVSKSEVNNVQRSTIIASQQQSQIAKKSNVLKEVEKLQKNREERRLRQAEVKAEKEAFQSQAPGNPHWELGYMIKEYIKTLEIKPLSENDPVEDHLITVCVRKRPLNKKEILRKEVDVITVPVKNQIIVHEPKNKVDLTKYLENQMFRFDCAFDESCTNEMVYKFTAQPLIKTIFDGGFATCFAYGQTGSGKTHTMGGDFNGKSQDCHRGIYAMVAADVFKLAQSAKFKHLNVVVSASFFEIYSGKVFDLLNQKAKLRILEDGKQVVQVVGLVEKVVSSTAEVLKLLHLGNAARTSGVTAANNNSSRSHAIFQIFLRPAGAMQKIHGKFSLIDLAGNERGADTSSANRQTRMEGAEINKSLLALKECIRALGKKGSHLPFRVSKLTQVLRDSFVGANSRTCMIAMISPGVQSCEHSLNTLRYADRVKELDAGDVDMRPPHQDLAARYENEKSRDRDEAATDLLQLRSLNENDMSQEMLNFHQVITELQVAEDQMLDNHKQTVEYVPCVLDKLVALLKSADNATYDQEAYCEDWYDMTSEAIEVLRRSQDIVSDYRAKMLAEEQLSRKTKRK